jgi:hypothetical protein
VYQHHHDKRSLGEVIAASNRILGDTEGNDPIRNLAVAVIGDALYDLTGVTRSNNQGHKMSEKKIMQRKEAAFYFFDSPDLDAWAQCTNRSADQWREVARRIAG